MKAFALQLAVLAATFLPVSPSHAQEAPAPVTAEYYYRIKWGSHVEFKELYKRNHEPILKELQKQGFITAMRMESPFTHLAGGPRWDLRVTITYRDPASAVQVGGPFDKATEAITARLYPDKAKLDAEEQRRFSLLEDHWDVIVVAE
jgi:hypothetical protein